MYKDEDHNMQVVDCLLEEYTHQETETEPTKPDLYEEGLERILTKFLNNNPQWLLFQMNQ